jgi:hypothetical protein
MAESSKRRVSCNWSSSSVYEETLENLEKEGRLPPKAVCHWRGPLDETAPTPLDEAVVVFVEAINCGFTPPGSKFWRELMHHYGLLYSRKQLRNPL